MDILSKESLRCSLLRLTASRFSLSLAPQATDHPETLAGRIHAILTPENSGEGSDLAVAVIEHFNISNERDEYYGMPILTFSGKFFTSSIKVGCIYLLV